MKISDFLNFSRNFINHNEKFKFELELSCSRKQRRQTRQGSRFLVVDRFLSRPKCSSSDWWPTRAKSSWSRMARFRRSRGFLARTSLRKGCSRSRPTRRHAHGPQMGNRSNPADCSSQTRNQNRTNKKCLCQGGKATSRRIPGVQKRSMGLRLRSHIARTPNISRTSNGKRGRRGSKNRGRN